jgi:hypothetical protein
VQLIENERGQALIWVLIISGVILITGYLGLQTQLNAARSDLTTQSTLDVAILRNSLVEILKDSTFCPAVLSTAKNGSAVTLTPTTKSVPLTQVNPGTSAFIETQPKPTVFNLLTVSKIQLTGLTYTNPQYSGNFEVVVTMPSRGLGVGPLSTIDIPITITTGPLACAGGP